MAAPRLAVGVIGAIGSGKTTAARLLATALGAPLLVADEVARELARPGGPLADALARTFPGLDRAAIAARIFTEPAAMQRLAALTDPPLANALRRHAALAGPLVIIEAANLPTLAPELVGTWLEVAAPEELALARAAAAHNWPKETILACWRWQQAQTRPEPRQVLDNRGDLAALEKKVNELARRLGAESGAPG